MLFEELTNRGYSWILEVQDGLGTDGNTETDIFQIMHHAQPILQVYLCGREFHRPRYRGNRSGPRDEDIEWRRQVVYKEHAVKQGARRIG